MPFPVDRLRDRRPLIAICGLLLALLPLGGIAAAPTHEQIVDNCKEQQRPQVQACMQGKRGSGNRAQALEQCKAAARPAAMACVNREEQKLATGKATPDVPKDDAATPPASEVAAVPTSFVAPPRTIADVTAILDSEKPDEATIARRKAEADAAPPQGKSGADVAAFYLERANARALLSRNQEALDDLQKALDIGKSTMSYQLHTRVHQAMALQYRALGYPKQAIAVFQTMVRDGEQTNHPGSTINPMRNIVQILAATGNIGQAEAYSQRVAALIQQARGSPNPQWRASYAATGRGWEADADTARAVVLEARGQYPEAEAAYRRAEAFRRASINDKFLVAPPPEQTILGADLLAASIAQDEAKQGRFAEAEADARRALLSDLKHQGKYNPETPRFVAALAAVLVQQNRYGEAEKLARTALDIQRTLGIADDSSATVNLLAHLGNILTLQRKAAEAAQVYAELDKAVAQWEPRRREVFELNASRIVSLYTSGQVDAGIAAAQEAVKRQVARSGETSFDTVSARATLAMGYARAGRDADAIREFKAAIPFLMAAAREPARQDDTMGVPARLQRAVEAYINVLARGGTSNDVAVETFALADAVRGHSVELALADASARMLAKDPALAQVVRTEQDLGKQIEAQLGALNNALSLPSGERDDQTVKAINGEIGKLRADRDKARQDIISRFPTYADLIDPKPPTVEQIKSSLRPGEALLSYYFGQNSSFVWAVPKDGPIAFAAIPLAARDLDAKVHRLRAPLEAEVTTLTDIPPFDVALGYELYSQLLKPVESAWKPQKALIVVTNGALGLLPLSLLPTAPATVDPDGPLFAGYKNVAWLARTHSVTMMPSVAALPTLRALPPGKPDREKLIGFGDPVFSAAQVAAQLAATATLVSLDAAPELVSAADAGPTLRGLPLVRRSSPQLEGVNSADLAMLPPLPDTAAELKAIAAALGADPAKALNLGKDANEEKVKSLDLSRYKVVAFATHGLVPGELDGLTQPALALSAPALTGGEGDGLLTMGEILALKLDADWVVLSACNTAAGAGEGAEAASGLARAFFYAGTRAILVTNWSVDSASARTLVSDIFHRQNLDPKLSRGEALRQAMLGLLDGPGYVDPSGKTIFSYAHPLFWAPYSVIGDGSGN